MFFGATGDLAHKMVVPALYEMLPYARLLGDAMKGDAILFARQDAIEAQWRVVDGILDGATPVHAYDRGTWGPAEADRVIARSGGWHRPQPKDCT